MARILRALRSGIKMMLDALNYHNNNTSRSGVNYVQPDTLTRHSFQAVVCDVCSTETYVHQVGTTCRILQKMANTSISNLQIDHISKCKPITRHRQLNVKFMQETHEEKGFKHLILVNCTFTTGFFFFL